MFSFDSRLEPYVPRSRAVLPHVTRAIALELQWAVRTIMMTYCVPSIVLSIV